MDISDHDLVEIPKLSASHKNPTYLVASKKAVDWRIRRSLPRNDWKREVDLDAARRRQRQGWPPKRKRTRKSAEEEDSSGESPKSLPTIIVNGAPNQFQLLFTVCRWEF